MRILIKETMKSALLALRGVRSPVTGDIQKEEQRLYQTYTPMIIFKKHQKLIVGIKQEAYGSTTTTNVAWRTSSKA